MREICESSADGSFEDKLDNSMEQEIAAVNKKYDLERRELQEEIARRGQIQQVIRAANRKSSSKVTLRSLKGIAFNCAT